METVEDGRKKIPSTQAASGEERNGMGMGKQSKRICLCGVLVDIELYGYERETSKKRSDINDRPLSENQ